jgi:hypothetical protein
VSEQLLDRVRALLRRALRELPDPSARSVLVGALARLDEPLRVAIAGKVKAGKSTLLNAMVGEELAPTDAGECTRIVTWYRDGPSYRVQLHLVDGPPEQRPFDRVSGAIRIDLDRPAEQVDHIEVDVPSRRLREHTLIDTPGIASLSTEVSLRTLSFLEADEERAAQADAVVYLLRHMHGSDLRFLEAFHGDDLVNGSPINAVGVLSRADEIGGCRLDAMETAGRVATRYQSDERLRRLCPIVVPVAGLLGAAGATIREDEFRLLATIAGAAIADVLDLLLTADRFVSAATPIPVAEPARRQLLNRLGLFGVRLAVQLIREGAVRSAEDLARELTARSGLDRLREILAAQFLGRSRVLKARSALAALDVVLRSPSPSPASLPAAPGPGPSLVGPRLIGPSSVGSGSVGSGSVGSGLAASGRVVSGLAAGVGSDLRARVVSELVAEAEEIRASAHEFTEVRLLHLVRSGRVPGRPEQLTEMERLLGGAGAEAASRLGLAADTVPDRLAVAADEALARWQRIAEHPLSARELRTAARATARSCEGIIEALRQPAR